MVLVLRTQRSISHHTIANFWRILNQKLGQLLCVDFQISVLSLMLKFWSSRLSQAWTSWRLINSHMSDRHSQRIFWVFAELLRRVQLMSIFSQFSWLCWEMRAAMWDSIYSRDLRSSIMSLDLRIYNSQLSQPWRIFLRTKTGESSYQLWSNTLLSQNNSVRPFSPKSWSQCASNG